MNLEAIKVQAEAIRLSGANLSPEDFNMVVDGCEQIAIDVINECREDGESDLRSVKSRISTAFCLLRKVTR